MKIRNGFVSNSSSSSFMIRGIELTNDLVDLIFINHEQEKQEFLELYNEEEKDFYYIVKNLEDYLEKSKINLSCRESYGDEYNYDNEQRIFIGKVISSSLEDGNVIEIGDFSDVDMELNKSFNILNPDILSKSKIKLYIQYWESH